MESLYSCPIAHFHSRQPICTKMSAQAFRLIRRQFAKYVAVGGIAFAADFATLFVLTHFAHWYYLASASAGFALGLGINYALCLAWIFDERAVENRAFEFTIFAAVGVAGLFLNNLLLWLMTDYVGLHYLQSKAIAAGFILIFNFTLRRQILFVRRDRKLMDTNRLPVSS